MPKLASLCLQLFSPRIKGHRHWIWPSLQSWFSFLVAVMDLAFNTSPMFHTVGRPSWLVSRATYDLPECWLAHFG